MTTSRTVMSLQDIINFTNSTNRLVAALKSVEFDIFKIHSRGLKSYNTLVEKLDEYLKNPNQNEIKEFLSRLLPWEVEITLENQGDLLHLMLDLFNFHVLCPIRHPNSNLLSSVQSRMERKLDAFCTNSKLLDPLLEHFIGYFRLSCFLRLDLPNIPDDSVLMRPKYEPRNHTMKKLIGNFYPSMPPIDYQLDDFISWTVRSELIPHIPSLSYDYHLIIPNTHDMPVQNLLERNLIENCTKVLSILLNVDIHMEPQQPLIQRSKYRDTTAYPGIILTSSGANSIRIPIEVKRFDISLAMSKFDRTRPESEDSKIFVEYYSQCIRYSRTCGSPISILSNYKDFIVFDLQNAAVSQEYAGLNRCKILRQISTNPLIINSDTNFNRVCKFCMILYNTFKTPFDNFPDLNIEGSKRELIVRSLNTSCQEYMVSFINRLRADNDQYDLRPPVYDDVTSSPILQQNRIFEQDSVALSNHELNIKSSDVAIMRKLMKLFYFQEVTMEELRGRMDFVEIISGSTFGSTNGILYRCETMDGEFQTVKVYDPIRSAQLSATNGDGIKSFLDLFRSFCLEVACLSILDNDSFPKITEIGFLRSNTATYNHELAVYDNSVSGLFFIYKYIDAIPLSTLTHRERLRFKSKTLDAVDYMHQQGLAHLDLTPHNILVNVNSRSVFITDFGFSFMSKQRKETFKETGRINRKRHLRRDATIEHLQRIDNRTVEKCFRSDISPFLRESRRKNTIMSWMHGIESKDESMSESQDESPSESEDESSSDPCSD
ncbi:uncharacterized protein RJT21DRAFT_113770 [Scheffersomyces amazonensis]|uniref:uncharacterized protein n=1 Tax=Scheffersomyces amazonensis TaxID=1078765 RepID=UPI00315D36AD